ncbi:MAG: DUF3126 family protein [Bauldia sp.]|nr:DUF3126 family protein [Bauldia sp.]MCW5715323.1 DUF3126 family protein [Bauldia sp.]MCW5718713.1 DUF3126 family protein [Bauldia sp.]
MNRAEIQKLETYFRKRFKLPTIEVKQRPRKDDSAELFIGDEFIGLIYRDDEDGETSYNFSMAILDIDLE